MENQITYRPEEFSGFEELQFYYQLTQNRTLSPVLHNHDFYEIIYQFNGKSVQRFDDTLQELSSGDVVFISPEHSHSFVKQWAKNNTFSLSITRKKFNAFLEVIEFEPEYGRIYHKNVDELEPLIMQLFQVGDQLNQQLNLLTFEFLMAAARSPSPQGTEKLPSALAEAVEQMKTPEHIGLGVDHLAEMAGYSRAQLNRLVNRHYGKTPKALIMDLRMSMVRELVQHSDLSFEDISEKAGYCSFSGFYSAFRSYFNCTPGDMRIKKNFLT